jgi:uncharacterized protein (UPF0276 family)
MPALVAGSLKRVLGQAMLELASSWPVCEVVPENWDPRDPADRAALISLNDSTTILLHSLSLNVLGPVIPADVVACIREWADILGVKLVTDHFCWSMTESHPLGVFVPPVEPIEILQSRVGAVKQALGIKLGVENICLSSTDPNFTIGYHDALTRVARIEEVPVLLDLENLRLDAAVSSLPVAQLLSYYDAIEVCGYHVAGSGGDDPFVDSHDQHVPDDTLGLLRQCYSRKNAPVIYERDYALDLQQIGEEVRRISAAIEGASATAGDEVRETIGG